MDENNKKKKKFSLYRLFNPQGSGKGVEKIPEGPDNISKCFKILGRNITNLFYLNLLLIFGNFPLMFGLFALSGNLNTPTSAASSALFAPLHGAMRFSGSSPVSSALYGLHGIQVSTSTPTIWTYIFFTLTLLVIFTFGFVNTGVSYLLRSIVRGDPIFFFQDFFGAIKKNIKQSLILGIIDVAIIGLCVYDIMFFYMNGSSLFYVNLLILCLYMMMRYYMYIILITFDLSIWKIIKNSLIFSMLGFKRNIMAFLGGLLMIGLEYLILSIFFPLGIIFPFVLFFSVPMFFGAFAAYPKIKQIMIDPQLNQK